MVELARTGFSSPANQKKKEAANKLDDYPTAATLDENNIIRVKTRITERIDTPHFLSPILLPNNCVFTQRLVEHLHIENYHAGTQLLLSITREEYWILGGRRTVRKIWNACVKCRRFKSKSPMVDLVSLPGDRVIELIPRKDRLARTVKLKTQSSTLIRPIQRVFPLELSGNDLTSLPRQKVQLTELSVNSPNPETPVKFPIPETSVKFPIPETSVKSPIPDTSKANQPQVSRCGCAIKRPKRLNLVTLSDVFE
ncbi:hypothetical protein AVEN_197043-1 [Araneus ventricosus]|uniref:Integrase zinc-binding domain-containing protein n=1 Tax=Araneus ventricosus TaxID=182803 RepID=A0A4Y2GFD3_ARAVE|nr:hypothetical protein AVEN_197043-1 [Araneus ventricosus]